MNTIDKTLLKGKDEQLFNAYSVMFYFAGSIITIEPEEEGLPEFCASGLLRNLPVTSFNPTFTSAIEFFRAPCNEQGPCCENVARHYQRLFADKDNSLAWPAESSWPSEMDTILHKAHGSIEEFYDRYTFRPENDRFLPADHLGIELLFLNRLITLYINAQEPLVKEKIKRDILSFTDSHLLNWLPEWAMVVTKNSGAKCFKGVANLILACVEDVKSLLVH